MSIWLNSIYAVAALALGLAGFVWLANKRFAVAASLVVFLLPLYLLKIRIFFVPSNVLEILIGLLFLVWLVRKKYNDIEYSDIRPFAAPALLILIGAILATLLSRNLAVSAGILKSWFVAPMIFVLMIAGEVKNGEQVKKILRWLVYSAGLVAMTGLVYYLAGSVTFDGRLAAFFLSPNHLAMYLVPGFLASLALFGLASKKEKAVFIFFLVVIGLALYLTFSYAAWLAGIAGALVWFYFSVKNKKKAAVLCGLLFLVLMGFLLATQLGSEKMNNILHSARSSGQSRQMIWKAAVAIGRDHPIFGIGPGLFQEYYLEYQDRFTVRYLEWAVPQPHNLALAFWLQTGLLGLAGFVWLIIFFFKKIIKSGHEKNHLAVILASMMIYILLHGLVDTTYFKNDLAIVFWLVIALAVSLGSARKAQPTT